MAEITLWTRDGKPLIVEGEKVWSRNGVPVGRIVDERVYGTDGNYVGTVVEDRLIFRSSDNTRTLSAFGMSNRMGSARAYRAGSGKWGDEPKIPD